MNENIYNPKMTFKQYLKAMYGKNPNEVQADDYAQQDLITEIYRDRNFPKSSSYEKIYYYLKKYKIPDVAIEAYVQLFNEFLDFKKVQGLNNEMERNQLFNSMRYKSII